MKRKRQSCLLAVMLAAVAVICIHGSARAADEGFFIQSYLPKELKEKLKVSLEMRYRLEARDDFDFSKNADRTSFETDTFHLLRARLMLDANLSESLRAFVQLEDSRIFGTTPANRWSVTFRD